MSSAPGGDQPYAPDPTASRQSVFMPGDGPPTAGYYPPYYGPDHVPGMTQFGNIDLVNRPTVHNKDGSISTVRSITVTDGQGNAILIPSVVGKRVVSDRAAIEYYNQTGQHLGVFRDEASADAYAESLHEDQAAQYLPPAAPKAVAKPKTTSRKSGWVQQVSTPQADLAALTGRSQAPAAPTRVSLPPMPRPQRGAY